MHTVKLIAGRSNKDLANSISKYLGIDFVKCTLDTFANGEIKVEINENVRGCNVFIIQTGAGYQNNSINDHFVETLLIIDACKRADAFKVNVVFACLPYARSDKKDRRGVPIGASVIINALEAAGCDRIISMDLHAGQTQSITQLPFDNLYGIKLHIDNLQNTLFKDLTLDEINEKYVLVSLDVGGAKRVHAYASRLKIKYAIMDKQRDYSKSSTVLKSILIGDVNDKIAICIDDICDTAGTLNSAVTDLKQHGAKSSIVLFTHGIFSNPAAERLNSCDFIEQVIVINTLDQTQNLLNIPKLQVIDAGSLFCEVIKRITDGRSISELFN